MAQSSRVVTVQRHDRSCALMQSFGACDCRPEISTERYERVCAHCGGKLVNRRRSYCSRSCKEDAKVRGKTAAERQDRDDEYKARGPEP